MRFGVHLEGFRLLVVLDLKILATIVHCIREFEVEVLDEVGREGASQQLNSMELVEFGRLG
jgi:hypothetical protein